MKKKSKVMKAIMLLLAVLFIVPMTPSALETEASTIEEIEARQDELANETAALEEEMAALREDESAAIEYQALLEEKILLTQEKIDTARENIKTLNGSIKVLEEKLDISEAQYADTMELLKERIRALYMMGDVGTIEILLNASSLYDFSMKTEMIKSVTEHDKELCDEITAYMEATEADRAELKEQKSEVAKLKKQFEADQVELEELMEENNALIEELQGKIGDKQGEIDKLAEEDAELQAELERLLEEKRRQEEEERKRREEEEKKKAEENETVYVPPTDGGNASADFGWPLPGYGSSWVTCKFGNGHYGYDIAAPYGTPIVAAESGEVLSASYHWSWGNNVFIYHNGTYSTRYAHMSSMAVSPGEWVSKGQVIGYVGNTGYSFGNHLHFEVYKNGSRVNPEPYLW